MDLKYHPDKENICNNFIKLSDYTLLQVFGNFLKDIIILKRNSNIINQNPYVDKIKIGNYKLIIIVYYNTDNNDINIERYYILKEEFFDYKTLISFYISNNEYYEDLQLVNRHLIKEFLLEYIDYKGSMKDSNYNDKFYHDFK